MNPTTVQIQARLGSTRLPGKVLYPLGAKRVLGLVVDRARRAEKPDQIILTVGDRPENDAIREWCDRNGVAYDTGPEENLLERHYQAAVAANSDPVVRVTGDCPFVPSAEIDRVISEHEHNEARYTTNHSAEMPIGTAVDAIDREVLSELRDRGADHPVRRLRDNPEEWDVVVTPNQRWMSVGDAHIAVDTPDDYWTLSDAVEAVGDEPHTVAEWVSGR
ncbi:cytidylyltransferase domain-containing protein [Natrinema halophilum]|uniref:NTP transferase domain-containing protein n=1 Tax=Natrinema halophilum TaxID=1699371 RepID=A0A7D5GKQ8_9EURY|nr:NTP transferase domain-containing protein [Natrinema halophilum]QLG48892.1 NTP transferase domain-containing protein [Natrinema halophilum]